MPLKEMSHPPRQNLGRERVSIAGAMWRAMRSNAADAACEAGFPISRSRGFTRL
jgi:hypothetical protein